MRLGLLLFIGAAWSCGGNGAPLDSGFAPDTRAPELDSGTEISRVAAPALPAWACPEGWRRVSADDVAPGLERCEPWPDEETPCAHHEVRLPGDEACRSVGSSCPDDGWPADLPETGVVYVRPGALAPPDGSRGAPYPNAPTALAALPLGTTTLALSVGDYPNPLVIDSSLAVRGACPAETILRARYDALTIGPEVHLELEDLSIVTDSQSRLRLYGASIAIKGVAFRKAQLLMSGADISLEDVIMRGVNDTAAMSIACFGDGSQTLRRVAIEDGSGGGILLSGMGTHSLRDIYLRRIGGPPIITTGTATLDRIGIEYFRETAITGAQGGRMSNVVVRGVTHESESTGGIALGGPWTLTGVHVRAAGNVALLAGAGVVQLEDAIFEGPVVGDVGRGRGIVIAAGGELIADRFLVQGVRDLGVLVSRRSAATLTDGTIRAVSERATGGFGRCVHGQLGANVHLERTRLDACTEVGLSVYGDTTATLRDVHISGVAATRCSTDASGCTGAAGIGLLSLTNGSIDAERFIVEEAALAGILVVENSSLDLRDGTVRGNPIGINVQEPEFDLDRVTDRVIFIDNARNLDSAALPVPSATASTSDEAP